MHPTRHPPSVLYYYVRKYGFGVPGQAAVPDAPIDAALPDFDAALAGLALDRKLAIKVVLYPTKGETEAGGEAAEWQAMAARLRAIAYTHGAKFATPVDWRDWTPGLYEDEMHPTLAGIGALARFLAAD